LIVCVLFFSPGAQETAGSILGLLFAIGFYILLAD